MAEIDLTGLLGIETPQARSQRLLEEGASLSSAIQAGSPAAVAAMNLPTAQASMRGSVGRLFGLDTRTPSEKLQAQLAGTDLSTSAGLSRAAELARNMGMDAQAVALATQAGVTRREEQDRSLRRKREQQIIDLAPRTEEREEETLALNRAKFAADQAAQLRNLGLSEERRAASQNAFLGLYGPKEEGEEADPKVTEIAQAIGTGALTLAEGQSIMKDKEPSNANDFYAWLKDNPNGNWTEYKEWEAGLGSRPSTALVNLSSDDLESLRTIVDDENLFGWGGLLKGSVSEDKFINEVATLMESTTKAQGLTMAQAIDVVKARYEQPEETKSAREASQIQAFLRNQATTQG